MNHEFRNYIIYAEIGLHGDGNIYPAALMFEKNMRQYTKCSVSLAGIVIPLSFRFPETENLFKDYICPTITVEEPLYVEDDLWNLLSDVEKEESPGPWTEFYQLSGLVSRFLLKYNRCIFHGVAFLWKDQAWIITAPSGTGKTTQICLWQKLFGREIEIINGDKPIIECRPDDTVWVYPSPWNGKENLSGTKSGKLAGIIYLEQAEHNEITRMDIRFCMIPIYSQFLFYADYEDEIRAVGRMEDIILRYIPVWKLKNLGDKASVQLTRKTLIEYIEQCDDAGQKQQSGDKI